MRHKRINLFRYDTFASFIDTFPKYIVKGEQFIETLGTYRRGSVSERFEALINKLSIEELGMLMLNEDEFLRETALIIYNKRMSKNVPEDEN